MREMQGIVSAVFGNRGEGHRISRAQLRKRGAIQGEGAANLGISAEVVNVL